MQVTEPSRAPRRRGRLALAAALVAAGCSGSTGGGCGSSCGGAFKTVDASGAPIRYTGTRIANVAQVRLTRSGFTFLDAGHPPPTGAAMSKPLHGHFYDYIELCAKASPPCVATTFDARKCAKYCASWKRSEACLIS